MAFAVLFLVATFVSFIATDLPLLIPIAYLFLSAITFFVYAYDKSAARRGRWRTSEGTLHFFALIGGWPGALLAQQSFRHKSKKLSFRVVLWVTVLLNCAAFGWVHTSDGRIRLDRLISLAAEML